VNAEAGSTHGLVRLAVEIADDWLDARSELAPAFYTAAFDLGIDALKQAIGIDADYRARERRSTVALEAHLVLLAPVPAGSDVALEMRIVDCDAKRLHVVQEMRLGAALVALRESMTVSFDLDARRSCPFGAAVAARIDSLYQAQRALPPYRGRAGRLDLARSA
jgi:acyl-CoA thioester hydrolase